MFSRLIAYTRLDVFNCGLQFIYSVYSADDTTTQLLNVVVVFGNRVRVRFCARGKLFNISSTVLFLVFLKYSPNVIISFLITRVFIIGAVIRCSRFRCLDGFTDTEGDDKVLISGFV